MLFRKQNCAICHNKIIKSKIKEYETIEGNKILCCEKCSKYIKIKNE